MDSTLPMIETAPRKARVLAGLPLGEILIAQGAVSADRLREGLQAQEERGGRLGEVLISLKACSEEQILKALAAQLELPYQMRIGGDEISQELVAKVPINFAKQSRLLPLRMDGDHVVVAMADPLDTSAVDNVRQEVIRPPKRFQTSIISRVKIMGGLNIAEKRLPQDGRIRVKLAGRDIDIRLSTTPTVYGERVVMRLLDKSAVLLDLAEIGMDKEQLRIMESLIHKSHGIILVTGPTGSGKTTTLYAALSKINRPDLNIMTIEDPVEYQLKGISQTPVNAKIELTFANGLRSFLRQDPDVIMVGEIRDLETAEIAIQASLTGHLVFSTVHTNDAAGAITRLVDMGVEPFLVASSLIGVLAQRLVRVLCKDCRMPYFPTPEELKEIGLTPDQVRAASGGMLYKPAGCDQCTNTGYRGRSGIYGTV